jgi:hypothetical protein
MLTFEAILGRPCYAKLMAVPNYTYLKMKMPGPKGVITVGSSMSTGSTMTSSAWITLKH